MDAVSAAEQDPNVAAIVIMGAGKTFIAGADITTLERAAWGEADAAADLHDMLSRIEHCSKPIVMGIHGTALGGGLELAMAGHYRVAVLERAARSARGQSRYHSGRRRHAAPAAAHGHREGARYVRHRKADVRARGARRGPDRRGDRRRSRGRRCRVCGTGVVARLRQDQRARAIASGPMPENGPLFVGALELAAKVRRRQVAPVKAVEAIKAAATLPFADGCRRERELFFECVRGEQAKAMIHVFFAERAAARVPEASTLRCRLRASPSSAPAPWGRGLRWPARMPA